MNKICLSLVVPLLMATSSCAQTSNENKKQDSSFSFESVKSDLFSLTIKPTPSDARVQIMNIRPKYQDGIKLKEGIYKIKISKKGYLDKIGNIDLKNDLTLNISLDKIKKEENKTTATFESKKVQKKVSTSKENKIFVKTNVEKPLIVLFLDNKNTTPIFYKNGMNLKNGHYIIEIHKNGYEHLEQNFQMKGEKLNLSYELKKESNKPKTTSIAYTLTKKGDNVSLKEESKELNTTKKPQEQKNVEVKKEEPAKKIEPTKIEPKKEVVKEPVKIETPKKEIVKKQEPTKEIIVKPTEQNTTKETKEKIVKKEVQKIEEPKKEEVKPKVVIKANTIVTDKYGNTYKTITSPYTSKIWLDKNLGAIRACSAIDDEKCFGDYYQWGRGSDGHEKVKSSASSTLSLADDPMHSRFIKALSKPYDWRDGGNDNLWQGGTGINNPCPANFRIPTIEELKNETINQGLDTNKAVYNSFLKLPSAGHRSNDNYMNGRGSWGNVWSSTIGPKGSSYLFFVSDGVGEYNHKRSNGISVRCIQN